MSIKKKKVIIIDDVELNRAILGEAFSKEYDILEADDGDKGLEKIIANEDELAAIFLDVIMPSFDGFSVLQELERREIMKKIPLFVITTEATDYVVEKAYDYGVIDVIQKPFNLLIIKRRVENIIELFKHRNQQKSLCSNEKISENISENSNNHFVEKISEKEIAYKKALAQIAKIINGVAK